jgi:hypothetical protein
MVLWKQTAVHQEARCGDRVFQGATQRSGTRDPEGAIMSKQSAAKEHQGYTRCTPQCGRCIHFKSDKVVATFGVGAFLEERNLRCKIGNFKVNKTAWCRMFELAAKSDALCSVS